MTRGDVDSENGPGTMDSLSDAAAGEELARNFSVVTKLKDERIARLEEMLNDAMTALERVSSADGDAVRDFSMERVLKAELARRDQVETQLLQRLRECDSRSIADKEQQLSDMLEATESIQTHFREEVLKMCKEIVDLKLNLRNTEQELGDKMRALSAAEEALFLEKSATAQHHDALVHERAARGEAEAEASKLRLSLQQVRERCNALETLAAEHDSLRGEISGYVEQIALARKDREATAADTARLLETIKEREKTIDVLEQAAAAREHDVMKLRKSLVRVQEEYDRVVMQAEQKQLVLEKAAAQLHDKMTKTQEGSHLHASGISSQPAAGVGSTFGDEGNRGVDAGGKSGQGAGVAEHGWILHSSDTMPTLYLR